MACAARRGGSQHRPFSDNIDWGRLWSTARIELGLNDVEFWQLTPVELDLLVKAQRRKERREAMPMALLVQMTANIHRDPKQRLQPFELDEVLGWMGLVPEPERREPAPAPPTPDELREKLRLAALVFPQSNGQEGHGR